MRYASLIFAGIVAGCVGYLVKESLKDPYYTITMNTKGMKGYIERHPATTMEYGILQFQSFSIIYEGTRTDKRGSDEVIPRNWLLI